MTALSEFSLLGGPVYRLGSRIGLVRGGTNTIRLGLTLAAFLWTVLVALAAIGGTAGEIFSLAAIGNHVRLLLAIPLLFIDESWVDPRMSAFVGMIVRAGIVPASELPAFESELARTKRWKNSWLPDVACFAFAVLVSVFPHQLLLFGTAANYDQARRATEVSPADLWYWIVCLPIFRFLLLRCLLRIGLWARFLWRLNRIGLHLLPTHPDGAAGLGYLEIVHMHFTPLVLAISAVQSVSLAEELATGAGSFEAVYPAIALLLAVDALLFLGPLLIVSPALWACKVKGLADYTEFAQHYVTDFDTKWLGTRAGPHEPLLGTSDLQSLADLGNSVTVVRQMRVVPASLRLITILMVAAMLPMLPLILFKYPLVELLQKFLTRLTGL